jgi:hypothetical protein
MSSVRITHSFEWLMSGLAISGHLFSGGIYRVLDTRHFEWLMITLETLDKLHLRSWSVSGITRLSHKKVRMLGRWLLVKRSLNVLLSLSNTACFPSNDHTAVLVSSILTDG